MTDVRAFVFGPKSGRLSVRSGRTKPVADFRIKIDVKAVQRQLSDMAKQIPFAASVALNDLAFQVMRKENSAMSDIFKSPRPFTQRATQVEKKASKSDLTAVVSIRPAQQKYLEPYEDGGQHSSGWKLGNLLVPVDGATDRFGQIPKGTLERLLNRPDVFMGTVKGISGIWQRPSRRVRRKGGRGSKGSQGAKKTALKLLYVWRPNTEVNKHLRFVERGRQVIDEQSSSAMSAAIQKAIRTAR